MQPIFLCGFMGCGKSTVGKILARKMGWKFVDLDTFIEEKEGMKISEIFEKKGEEYFRKLETQSLKGFENTNTVVATGGGALLSDENGEIAKKAGMVVFIDTYFIACYNRIKDDPRRPIAFNSTRGQLEERYRQRRPKYEKNSTVTISGGYPPIVIASKIAKLFFSSRQGCTPAPNALP